MKKDISQNQIVIYENTLGQPAIEVSFEGGSVWLTQEKIADLFDVQRPAITKHLKNIFESGELDELVVCSKMEHTTIHGAIDGKLQVQTAKYYNLDAVLSVGYRVNSREATHFRIWATARLNEYITKGFTIDSDRLKNLEGGNYWKELLDEISDIRCMVTLRVR